MALSRAFGRLLATAAVQQSSSAALYTPQLLELGRTVLPACLRHFHSCNQHSAAAAEPEPVPHAAWEEPELSSAQLTPRQVVELLDRFIVGQDAAKKAVANALRNRWRRHKVPSPLREEIHPKNLLMIGPTGCGKTEIARRLAKLANAPFVKVEATKFTEVGFHGRDVDQIIRDLVDNAIIMMRQRLRRESKAKIDEAVEERILSALLGEGAPPDTRSSFRALYREGDLDERLVELELPASPSARMMGPWNAGDASTMQEMVVRVDKLFGAGRGRGEKRKMKISEARPLVEEQEAERYVNSESVTREAILAVEQDGIVFIDEIDKIVTSSEHRYGGDASAEGVQRDLLPIIEGSTVSTKHGNVNTDYILFICSGAFHSCKPADMLAELQGRLPIRVELKGLTAGDFYKILTEPESNMIKQQQALLSTENVELIFTDAAIHEIARVAEEVNTNIDNIGARRLHTILERILEDVSFDAPEKAKESGSQVNIVIDKEDVLTKIGDLLKKQDLSRYVL
ncbi:hypothetical protein D9Q98_000828 [Chlorella vulgaris]|uniref:Uncharacterized protein n=1 Tax=Chlorella vulgaris TaxID=3077 RepID=A0A9D4TYR9_CHLVU|nr:hypothetical protein D9Q98_000828 [Chlorella vulgaris]